MNRKGTTIIEVLIVLMLVLFFAGLWVVWITHSIQKQKIQNSKMKAENEMVNARDSLRVF